MATTTDDGRVKAIIDNLDLTAVEECVQQRDHLDAAGAAAAVAAYRRFLYVCWYHWRHGKGDGLAAIDLRADQAWHCHLTMRDRYAQDCARIFGAGYLLDHEQSVEPTAAQRLDANTAYDDAGVPRPVDQRAKCVWSIIARP